ncbi:MULTISPECIES: hypothetical protein [Streptomyces]
MQYLPWLLFCVPLGTLADRVDRMVLAPHGEHHPGLWASACWL